MKKFTIIYWKKRNYKGIDFMDYSLVEKWNYENLMMPEQDFMFIWETQKKTKETFENWLNTQKNKLENEGHNYRDAIYELRYWKTNLLTTNQ